jgi:methionyl-tRNA formyltransferase
VNLLLLGGTHPRHLYFLNAVANHPAVELVGALVQSRETMLPRPPEGATAHDRQLWAHHFSARDAKEAEYFGAQEVRFDARRVAPEELNAPHIAAWVYDLDPRPDIAIIFGCGMIRGQLFAALPEIKLNLHLGLSPRYRGAATLFWPQYFLEPQWAGTTLHQIVDEPDAGRVLHQSVPVLKAGDTIHDVSCRAVSQATADTTRLLHRFPAWEYREQRNTGKCFLARDFQPAHLRLIYDGWEDRIVDAHLEGAIGGRDPKPWRENLREVEYV